MATPSTDGMIRNINQTVQEREIIKTAPDLIIYIEGKTYLLNPYVTNTVANQPYTFVSFNDYIQNFSSTVDVDLLTPGANFTLQVPIQNKYLFQAPGGNNLIESMMEVQVFAKGYFASGDGNTVYQRIFKGLTSHISHTENGMFLEISVQCNGILHLMEYMYIDLNVADVSNSQRPATWATSNQANMNPYEMLADTFLRGVTFEGFQLNVITAQNSQQTVSGSQWDSAIRAGYINKWQSILVNLRKEVHILGYKPGSVLPADVNGLTSLAPDGKGTMAPSMRGATTQYAPPLAQNAPNPDFYVDIIRGYLPDMNTGSINLTNGRITSRLERIRTIVQMIGYEGYQDLDGTIIFKAPLYNLDVTNIDGTKTGSTTTPSSSSSTSVPKAIVNITETTNPFVVHLSEIETESESEDQQAIRATRITIQPDFTANQKFIQNTDNTLRPIVSHIDIPKLAKFGLREEPARTLQWLGSQDKVACYTYAVSELTRANRGWRTYNLTIPLRPELKLGFPMYLPHKDMYGYIKSISVSYAQGGVATMSIMLDSLRKRPVFPTVASSSGILNPPILYTTQPNLVMQWTSPPSSSSSTSSTSSTSGGTSIYGLPSADSTVNLVNTSATQPQPTGKPIYAEEMEVVSARQSQYGTSWSTKADTRTKNFRVQLDSATADDAKNKNGNGSFIQPNKPFFSSANWYVATPNSIPASTSAPLDSTIQNTKPTNSINSAATNSISADNNKGVNMTYLQKILSSQPFTDEGGYELSTPFPWGRWKNLKEAIYDTHYGVLVANSISDQTQQVTGTDVFLFAGVGSPSTVTGTAATLQSQLTTLSNVSNLASSATSFEIVTPKAGEQQASILAPSQPDNILLSMVQTNTEGATDMFLIGNIAPQPSSSDSLAAQLRLAGENNPAVVGTTPKATATQGQQFASSLVNQNSATPTISTIATPITTTISNSE